MLSLRIISNVFMYVMSNSLQTFGIGIFFLVSRLYTSSVTTMHFVASACATSRGSALSVSLNLDLAVGRNCGCFSDQSMSFLYMFNVSLAYVSSQCTKSFFAQLARNVLFSSISFLTLSMLLIVPDLDCCARCFQNVIVKSGL